MSTDTVLMSTDTTPFALPLIGGVVLAVPCRVPQKFLFYCRVGTLGTYVPKWVLHAVG